MGEITTDVVIIGGGPTGLTLATELGRQGVQTVLVDSGHAPLPGVRAGGISHQMMEQLRRYGLADPLRETAPIPAGWARSAVYARRLSDRDSVVLNGTVASADLTAEGPQNAPSAVVERLMRDALEQYASVQTRYGYRFEGQLSEDADGVHVRIDGVLGDHIDVRGAYLVGCDGANSLVRQSAGIDVLGSPAFATRWTMQFESPDLREAMGQGVHNQYWAINSEMVAYFLQRDDRTRWTLHVEEATDDFVSVFADPEAMVSGVVGVPVTVTAAEPVKRWRANAFWASALRRRRVFLAGDAAHAMPPGGLGLHLGVLDAANLGWKLAAVVQRWGGEALLDSYEAERIGFARVYAQAVHTRPHPVRQLLLTQPDATRDQLDEWLRETNGPRIDRMIRTIYDTFDASEVVFARADGRDDDDLVVPGRRLPHRWLGPGESVFDRIGDHPVLFLDSAKVDAFADVTAAGVPLDIVVLPPGTYEEGSILVRPDRVVAWSERSGIPAEEALPAMLGRRPGISPAVVGPQAEASSMMW